MKEKRSQRSCQGIQGVTTITPLKVPIPIPNKSRTKETPVKPEALEVEAILGEVSSSEPWFPSDYIPPQKYNAPLVTFPKNVNHILVIPNIP